MTKIKLDTIKEALEDLKKGNFIVVVDDEDRENEGDLIIAAEAITPEKVNFMETEARGLLCIALTKDRCKELDLPLMVSNNTSCHETPFTISIDYIGKGCTTGISAYDRATTINALTKKETIPSDFGKPGHVFPLIAQNNGVFDRVGHTEAAVDFCKLALMYPAGVLIEIKKDDGEMARLPELREFADKHNFKLVSIADLIKYKIDIDCVEKGVEVSLPTSFGDFRAIPFRQNSDGKEHLVLFKGEWSEDEPITVRLHSSCMTGDIFGSKRCECGEQLHLSLDLINKEGKGAIIYLNQEGRGIGLMAKIEAYKLQEEGLDTVEANVHLGFEPDERDYGVAAKILKDLGLKKIKLVSNNPDKGKGLEEHDIEVVEYVPLEVPTNKFNEKYMKTKKNKMGHKLHL